MAPLNPNQVRTRDRFETLIGVMAPALNLVLAVGDRISRTVESEDHEYYPPRTSQVEPPPPSAPPDSEIRGD
ncbi:MAG: hypothetical protein H0T15_01580 [Thermoleophilaceae bacterium]|nr:hypothetical protein [Thermoleophilaceae bacterium]